MKLPSEAEELVHILWHGKALCGQPGLPCEWPAGHQWVGLPDVKEQDAEVKSKATWCPGCMAQFEQNQKKVDTIMRA